ncbi:MAG: serine/threonine protein kinase [Acidimicrobiales bacterium]|nr:serine/threonine protein kinase [Acidimicrobiales bacterium]
MAVEIPGYGDFEEIARGGFGVVYRAHDVGLGRVVAVKVLSRVELDDQALERFDRERRAMGALSWHPHIVVVHESGRTGSGEPYLVMEYLEGGSLADDLTARGPFPWEEAVARIVEVAGALQVAHEAGLLHRDLKPANVMRGPYGEAKLTDFGIVGTEDAGNTATGMISFTLGHAAPEVLQGQRATTRSDVYSLASTLYELVAGRAPFLRPGEDSIVPAVMRTINEPVPDLGRPDVPAALAVALTEAMAKDPATRPADAAAFGRRLQQVQREAGVAVTELRLDPKAGGGDPARSGATVTTAPPPTAPSPSAPPTSAGSMSAPPAAGPPPAPSAGGDGSRRGLVVGAVAAAVLVLVVAVVAVVALRGGGSSGDTAAATTTTAAVGPDDAGTTGTTAVSGSSGAAGGSSDNADLESFCDTIDEYAAAADALLVDPNDAEARATVDELGPVVSEQAVALAQSGLDVDEQARLEECTNALSEAGQG